MPPKAMASSTNSYWAIGIVTREGDKHGAGAVTMAFARSNRDFKLLPRHRERALDMSLLHHPHVLDEYQGYFKSAKLRAREGHTQGHLHVCSCRYPDAKLRGLGMFGAVAPKAQQEPAPEPEEEMVMPTKAQRVELFDLMDTSGDGSLTDREVAIAVSTQWPQFDNQEALKVAMHTADTSQDGTIGRKEFGLLLEYLVFFNNLWSKFAELDSGGDGKLDVEEFKKGCKMVGIKLTAAEAESEFATMDMDGGGTIVFAEFCVWSARRAAHGHDDDDDDEADGVSGELALERDSDESQDSDEDKAPTPPRTPTPPLRSASGRRVRVPELARGRMTRLPKNDQAQETQHPTHFTVWIITKQSNTANIYPHLRNLAHVFMSDSSNLVPFLGLHRDWLAGDLKVYDPNVVTKPPHGVLELLLPVESKPKQTALFGAPPPAAATSSKQHTGDHNHGSSKTPRDAHTPKTPRGDASARVHTPRSRDAKRAAHAGEDGATAEEREQAAAAAEELRAVKEAAVLKLQARVRGMLGRITKTKLIGAVGGLTKDSNEMQLARERRHLWQTRREIAVIDWPQELRRAAIAADLPALQEALKHCSADASASGTSTNINTATEVGMTALHYACCSGKDEIVMELLQAGADPRVHTRRAWSSHSHSHGGQNADGGGGGSGSGGGSGAGAEKTASRSVQHATARAEKTPADYAHENKMFTMQKMCQQRAFDMTRDDERMAMLRKKQEIEERFGTPRSSRKLKYKEFSLKDTAELKSDQKSPRGSPRRAVIYNSRGERMVLPPPLTVPERHRLSLQKYMAQQQSARQRKRPNPYPQFGVHVETFKKQEDFHIHLKAK